MAMLGIGGTGIPPATMKELGKAVADRYGIPQDLIREDWSAIEGYGDTVWANLTISIRMDNQEFNDLFKVAQERAAHK